MDPAHASHLQTEVPIAIFRVTETHEYEKMDWRGDQEYVAGSEFLLRLNDATLEIQSKVRNLMPGARVRITYQHDFVGTGANKHPQRRATELTVIGLAVQSILAKQIFAATFEGTKLAWATAADGSTSRPSRPPRHLAVFKVTQSLEYERSSVHCGKEHLAGADFVFCLDDSALDIQERVKALRTGSTVRIACQHVRAGTAGLNAGDVGRFPSEASAWIVTEMHDFTSSLPAQELLSRQTFSARFEGTRSGSEALTSDSRTQTIQAIFKITECHAFEKFNYQGDDALAVDSEFPLSFGDIAPDVQEKVRNLTPGAIVRISLRHEFSGTGSNKRQQRILSNLNMVGSTPCEVLARQTFSATFAGIRHGSEQSHRTSLPKLQGPAASFKVIEAHAYEKPSVYGDPAFSAGDDFTFQLHEASIEVQERVKTLVPGSSVQVTYEHKQVGAGEFKRPVRTVTHLSITGSEIGNTAIKQISTVASEGARWDQHEVANLKREVNELHKANQALLARLKSSNAAAPVTAEVGTASDVGALQELGERVAKLADRHKSLQADCNGTRVAAATGVERSPDLMRERDSLFEKLCAEERKQAEAARRADSAERRLASTRAELDILRRPGTANAHDSASSAASAADHALGLRKQLIEAKAAHEERARQLRACEARAEDIKSVVNDLRSEHQSQVYGHELLKEEAMTMRKTLEVGEEGLRGAMFGLDAVRNRHAQAVREMRTEAERVERRHQDSLSNLACSQATAKVAKVTAATARTNALELKGTFSALRCTHDDLLAKAHIRRDCQEQGFSSSDRRIRGLEDERDNLASRLRSTRADLSDLQKHKGLCHQQYQETAQALNDEQCRGVNVDETSRCSLAELNRRGETLAWQLQEERHHGADLQREISAACEAARWPSQSTPDPKGWGRTRARLQRELQALQRWKREAAGSVQRMGDGLQAARMTYARQVEYGRQLEGAIAQLGRRAQTVTGFDEYQSHAGDLGVHGNSQPSAASRAVAMPWDADYRLPQMDYGRSGSEGPGSRMASPRDGWDSLPLWPAADGVFYDDDALRAAASSSAAAPTEPAVHNVPGIWVSPAAGSRHRYGRTRRARSSPARSASAPPRSGGPSLGPAVRPSRSVGRMPMKPTRM